MSARHRTLALFMTLLALVNSTAWGELRSVRTLPADPIAGEPFVLFAEGLVVGKSATLNRTSANVQDGAIRIDARLTVDISGGLNYVNYNAVTSIAGLPAGTFPVLASEGGDVPTQIGSVRVAPAIPSAAPGFRNLSGTWFNEGEPGWGVNIVQGGSGALFIVWLTFEPVAAVETQVLQKSTWLVMSDGRWLSPTEYRGLLYRTTASPVNIAFDPKKVTVMPAGYATLRFTSPTEAQFHGEAAVGQFPVFEKVKTIRRMAF